MAQAIDYVKVAEALLQVVMGVGLPLLRVAYDPVGDTLYVHFTEEPVKADDSEFIENDVSVRYRGEDVVEAGSCLGEDAVVGRCFVNVVA
jgi:uncharacterized protein YuzE